MSIFEEENRHNPQAQVGPGMVSGDKALPLKSDSNNVDAVLKDYLDQVRAKSAELTQSNQTSGVFAVEHEETTPHDKTAFENLPAQFYKNTNWRYRPGANDGQQLNSLDIHMSAGLEQYLPTQLTRLKVIKRRLEKDLAYLAKRIKRYEAIPNPSAQVQEKIHILYKKQETLLAHNEMVDLQFQDAILQQGSPILKTFYQLNQGTGQVGSAVSNVVNTVGEFVSPSALAEKLDPARAELRNLGDTLKDISGLLSEQLRGQHHHEVEISELIQQYDSTLVEIEKIAETFKKRRFFGAK